MEVLHFDEELMESVTTRLSQIVPLGIIEENPNIANAVLYLDGQPTWYGDVTDTTMALLSDASLHFNGFREIRFENDLGQHFTDYVTTIQPN